MALSLRSVVSSGLRSHHEKAVQTSFGVVNRSELLSVCVSSGMSRAVGHGCDTVMRHRQRYPLLLGSLVAALPLGGGRSTHHEGSPQPHRGDANPRSVLGSSDFSWKPSEGLWRPLERKMVDVTHPAALANLNRFLCLRHQYSSIKISFFVEVGVDVLEDVHP